jgi:hypothetical protein
MNQILDNIFVHPETGYLSTQELRLLSRYVSSLPDRIKLYRQLREQETQLMQTIVNQLPGHLTETGTPALEQSIKQAVLMLRYVAMGMLIDDSQFAMRRLASWLPTMVKAFQTQPIDQPLQQQLRSYLSRILTDKQLEMLKPGLEAAQPLLNQSDASGVTSLTLVEVD